MIVAVTIRCDRCGRIENNPINWKTTTVDGRHVDLCDECRKGLDAFMNTCEQPIHLG